MSKNLFSRFSLIILSLLLLAVVGGYVSAQAPLNTTVSTGTGFTYQGYLEDSNGAVDGKACDFKFTLYDNANPVSGVPSVTASNISVSHGKFVTTIDFGTSAFTGDAREMLIEVRCPTGSGSYTALSPRVALTAAPYALGLRPGAVISGTEASNSILRVVNTDTTGSGAGIVGESQSSSGAGISGWNVGNSGGYAIYGQNSANAGTPYGIYGFASGSGSATSYGIYGKSNSSAGTGVGGVAPMNGVYGEATATSGSSWGVYGKTNSPNGYGVYGLATDTSSGTGVLGKSPTGTGVRGETVSWHGLEGIVDWTQHGNGIGIYAAGGFYGTAAQFENATTVTPTVLIHNMGGGSSPALVVTGTTHMEGQVTWKAVTSYLSIPGSAFVPQYYNYLYHYEGIGNGITPDDSTSTVYFAPVQLPHRATITKFTFYWSDSSNDDGTALLYRTNLQGSEDLMALTQSSGGSSSGSGTGTTVTSSSSDTTIDNATVDNSSYTYYAYLHLPTDSNDATIIAYGISIEYTITQPY